MFSLTSDCMMMMLIMSLNCERHMRTRFGDRIFSDAGTDFLLLCEQTIQSTFKIWLVA